MASEGKRDLIIESLNNRNIVLEEQVDTLTKEKQAMAEHLANMQEQLNWLKRQVFGQKSDKVLANLDVNQPLLDGFENPAEEDEPKETQTVPEHKRKKKRKKKGMGDTFIDYPEDLPKEEIYLDVPPAEKTDQETGEPLVLIREERVQKLAMKGPQFYLKEYVRPIYAKKSDPESGIVMSSLPEFAIDKSPVDVSIIAFVMVSKFIDHLPLYRIEDIFRRHDIRISRRTLANWVLKIGELLSPLYELMRDSIFSEETIFVDESPVKLFIKGKGKCSQAYMWVYAGGGGGDPPYRIYEFCLNRKYENVTKNLSDYKGFMHSDQYGAYERLATTCPDISWVPCMAHVRRRFLEAETGDREFSLYVARKIRHLFKYERIAWKHSEDIRLRIRREKEEPIINDLIIKVKSKLVEGAFIPKSKYKKALEYFMNAAPYMKNYLEHPDARLDNNVAERAVKPLTIGRKNWLFLGKDGGKATASILSLAQTCKAIGINPEEYLKDVLVRINSTPCSQLAELLPDRWLDSRQTNCPTENKS